MSIFCGGVRNADALGRANGYVAVMTIAELKQLCDAKAGRPGFITLLQFAELLRSRHRALRLGIRSLALVRRTVKEIGSIREGRLLIADGRGHTVGLASAERVLVDADPNCPAAIDLRNDAEGKLSRCLQCRGDQMLSLLIIQ